MNLDIEVPYIPKVVPENVTNLIPYTTHVLNNKKEFKTAKQQIKKETQAEYDKWFKDF
jgi:hypothetical protein